MVNHHKGTMMGTASCERVRQWLPLLVDDSDGLACEGNDLNAEDRRLIEQHLAECSSCRQHQAALEKAISVLSIAAADMEVELRTPSLWPRLEERIQRHQEQSRSKWLWTLRAICPEGIRITANRFFCGCGHLRSVSPRSSSPGLRDSLGDFLGDRVGPLFEGERSRLGRRFPLASRGSLRPCCGRDGPCSWLLWSHAAPVGLRPRLSNRTSRPAF